MIMFFILLTLITFLIGYYWYQKRATASNRYRKNPKKVTPALNLDADAVLGIKRETQPVMSQSYSADNVHVESESPSDTSQKSQQASFSAVLYLMAPDDAPFGGYELLQALLSAGLRYGKHRIFHRHQHKDGRGEMLFHCASAQKPGTFDPSAMGGFSTRGLCLFFSTDTDNDPLSTFDLLLDTLDQLTEDLGGVVHDEHHQVFTKEHMVKYRQRIRDIETSKTTTDLFAEIE